VDYAAGGCGGCAEGGGYFYGVWVGGVVGAFYAVAGGEEGVEALDEVWVAAEEG